MANQNFKVKKGLEVGTALTATSHGLNVTGVVTATQFSGDGSGLTGVTAAGSGVVIQEEGSSVGTAATINFIGSNVTAAISGGVASVTITSGSSDVVSDTTPQLGGNLDLNSKDITGTGNISITGGFNATGVSTFQESVTFQSHASFGDNDKANFGAGNDLQIYHDGSDGYIDNVTGELYIRDTNAAGTNRIFIQPKAGENAIIAREDGNVELYYDNSKKFETTNTGATITGELGFGSGGTYQLKLSDNQKIRFGAANDLQIYHDGSNSYIAEGGTGSLFITGSEVKITNAAGTQNQAVFTQGGAVSVYHNNSKKFETTGVGATVFGTLQSQQLNVSGITTLGNLKFDAAGSHIEFTPSSQSGSAPYMKFWVGNNSGAQYAQLDGTNAGSFSIHNTGHPNGEIDIRAKSTVSMQCNGYYAILAQASGATKIWHPASQENILNPKFETTAHGVVITGVATATSFSGSGSSLTGLTGASAGTFGASNATPIITVDSNGRITGISTVATAGAGGGGGISNIVEDTTPQLGGNLDLNSKIINGSGNLDYTGNLKVTGISTITGVAGFSSHVTLPDHAEIQVGSATGGDLKIYHDGTNSYVSDVGTGGLKITSGDVYIRNVSDQDMIHASSGSFVKLYHNNALRLQTTGTGVNITDNLNVAGVSTFQSHVHLGDSDELRFGAGDDLRMYHDGTHSYIHNDTGNLRIESDSSNINDIQIVNNSTTSIVNHSFSYSAKFISGGSVELYRAGSKKFETTSSGATVTGTLTATAFSGDGSALTNLPASGITTSQSNTQVTYNVGASGNNYVITGPGYSNSDNNPDLYLVRGQRYRFINATGSSHPFRIQSDTSGTAYTDGVSGSQSGTQEFNVQHDAPSRLFYQCTIHSGMIGNIYITGGGQWENTSVAASGTPKVYTDYNVGIGTDDPGNHKLHLYGETNSDLRLTATGNDIVNIFTNSNRSSANTPIFAIKGEWNGNQVANMKFVAGDDTTNKDDGYITFNTRASGDGASTERLRINSDGTIKFATSNSSTDYLEWGGNPRLVLQAPSGLNGLRIYSDTTPLEVAGSATTRKISMGGNPNYDLSISASYSLSSGGHDSSPKVFLNATRHNGSTTVTSFQTSIQAVSASNTAGDGYLGLGASATPDDLVIRPSGNIGIGENSPYYKLHLKTNNNATSLSGGSGGDWGSDGIRIENTNATVSAMSLAHFRNYDADWHIGSRYVASNNSNFVFLAEGSEKLRIDVNGNVKIGTISDTNNAVTNCPVYIAMQTDITDFGDDEGGASAGLVRIEETGLNNNRYHGIDLRNTNSGDIRILNQDVATSDRGDLVIAMPDGDANDGIHNKMRFNSIQSSIQISGKGGAVAGNNDVTHTDIYIATKTGVTAVNSGAGGEQGGLIRFEDIGSNNNRYHGIELRNRNSGDVRILNLDEATTNKASLVFATDDGSDITEKMRLTSSGFLQLAGNNGVTTGDNEHIFRQGQTSYNVLQLRAESNSYAASGGGAFAIGVTRSASSSYSFAGWYSGNGSSPFNDREYNFRGDGHPFSDGSTFSNGADYAEYFEWSDGNPTNEDRRGLCVVLDGDKIREAVAGEDPIGVVSGNPSVVGDSAWNKWKGKHLRDEYGSYLLDENGERQLNPDYDPDTEYTSREDRPEWDIVGLMGKIRIRTGQVTGSRWIKMRDISANIQQWLVR